MDAGYGQALYFPYIHFADEDWLKTAALYYDSISRIVPYGYDPRDSEFVTKLRTEGQFIRDLHPLDEKLFIQDDFLLFAEECLADKSRRDELLSSLGSPLKPTVAVVHDNKFEVGVLYRLSELGLAQGPVDPNEEWHTMDPLTGAMYMTLLANRMAEVRGLPLVTDDPPFQLLVRRFQRGRRKGGGDFALGSLVIKAFMPADFGGLTADQIISFRNRSELQRIRFYEAIREVSRKIRFLPDPRAYEDQMRRQEALIRDAVADLELCFLNSSIAYVTALIGVSLPAWALDASTLSHSAVVGVTVGSALVAGISIQKALEWHRTRKNSPWSYVLSLRNDLQPDAFLRSLLRGETLL